MVLLNLMLRGNNIKDLYTKNSAKVMPSIDENRMTSQHENLTRKAYIRFYIRYTRASVK